MQVLRLDHNEISGFPIIPPEMILTTCSLVDMNISHNRFETINDTVSIFNHLRILDASWNMISGLADGMSCLTSLTKLNLSHNALVELPSALGSCKALNFLDLSHNRILEMNSSMSQLKNLQILNFSHNNLADCSGKVVAFLSSLESLNISNNNVSKLPAALYSLGKLAYLDISHNQISALGPRIGQLVNMVGLKASHNLFTEIPPELCGAVSIQELDISHNSISSLPSDLVNLRQLRRIILSHNSISSSPSFLQSLPRLLSWNLSWNHIKGRVEDSKIVDKSFNPVTDEIPYGTLRRLTQKAWDKLSLGLDGDLEPVVIIPSKSDSEEVAFGREAKLLAQKKAKQLSKTRQTMAAVIRWQKKLHKHIKTAVLGSVTQTSRENILMGVENNPDNLLHSESQGSPLAELDVIISAGLQSLEKMRTSIQFAFLCSKVKVDICEIDVDGDNDLNTTIIESLDLGLEFQKSIDLFEQAANELAIAAIADWCKLTISQANSVKDVERVKVDFTSGNSLRTMVKNVRLLSGINIEKHFLVDGEIPRILHFPRLGSLKSELYLNGLDCYLGLGLALVKRSDSICRSIRQVERRAGFKLSSINIANRFGEDLVDLVEDQCEATSKSISAHNRAAGMLSLKDKRLKSVAQFSASSGVQYENSNISSDSKSSKKKSSRPAKSRAPPVIDDTPISEFDGRKCISYLVSLRKCILIWASKLLDSASECLSLHDWSSCESLPKRKVGEFVEAENEQFRGQASLLAYVRGRAYVGLNCFDEALKEFNAVKILAPKFLKVHLDIVKVYFALGKFDQGRNRLLHIISKECAMPPAKFEDPSAVFAVNKELGMLLMFATAHIDALRAHGVENSVQVRVFGCRDGLLLKKQPLGSEVLFYRPLNHKRMEVLAEIERKKVADNELNLSERDNVQGLIKQAFSRFHFALSQSKDILFDYESNLK